MGKKKLILKAAGFLLVLAFGGCSPKGISKSPPKGLNVIYARVEIVNNTKFDVETISGLLGEWNSTLFSLIPAGEVRYVYSTTTTPKTMDFTYSLKMGTPIRLYANGRWSKMRLVDNEGNIHNDWNARGAPPDCTHLFRQGMALYLVDGNNGDLYLTNVPIK